MTYKKRVSTNPDIYEVIDREDIQYGDYIQYGNRREAWQEGKPEAVAPTHKTRVTTGDILGLLGAVGYGEIHKAAYPADIATTDTNALFFIERARNPSSGDSLIDVAGADVTDALAYFVSQSYITAEDKTRIQAGVVL